MTLAVEYIYRIHDKFSKPLRKFASGTGEVIKKMTKMGIHATKLAKKFEKMGKSVTKFGKGMSLKVTAPIALIGGLSLKSAAQLETMETSFKSMLGGADKARQMMKKLTDFTAKTPFQLPGVGSAAKTLLGFGVSSEDLIDKLGMLGDIAAGSGAPLTDMASIFGKIKAKGKAMTEEIMQMSDRGIPIIDSLAKGFGVPKDAIFKMASEGKLSFEVIEQALKKLTTKGGIYHKQMEEQSKTLSGVFSTLKDNTNLLMGDIGQIIAETFDVKNLGVGITESIEGIRKAIKEFAISNPVATKSIAMIIAVVGIMGPALIGLGQTFMALSFLIKGTAAIFGFLRAMTIKTTAVMMAQRAVISLLWIMHGLSATATFVLGGAMKILAFGVKAVTVVMKALNWAMRANPIGLVITLVGALIGGFAYLYNETGSISGAFEAMGKVMLKSTLLPINLLIKGITYLIELGAKLPDKFGGSMFKGAAEGIKDFQDKMNKALTGSADINPLAGISQTIQRRTALEESEALQKTQSVSSAQKEERHSKLFAEQSLNVTGGISVAADQGSKVTSNNITLDPGRNMPFAGAR